MKARLILNEIRRSNDVMGSVSVGRRALVDEWLRSLGLDPSKATLRGKRVDYAGSVDLDGRGLTSLVSPDGFSFGNVGGDFWCNGNQLASLEGGPKSVGGNFWCNNNQLASLVGAPENVGGGFWCNGNQLASLEGGPKSVGGGFWCYSNQLTSLKGGPKSVGKTFSCDKNQLTSLEGAPKSVGGNFWCHNNSVKFTDKEVRAVSSVKLKVYV